jgi:bacterioferritin (cytochrome b1)
MNTLQAIPVLNELLRILCRSLPAYLADAKPWTSSGDQQLRSALDHLVADQRRYAQRVTEAIVEIGGLPDPGRFSLTLMAKHDLSLEFLRQEVIYQQEEDVLAIEQYAAELEGISSLHSLAEEILGNARGHLDILREMMNAE